jgi:protoporphyrinogen oxidase
MLIPKNTSSSSRDGAVEAVILGGGMTGLAAGCASGLPVYEAEEAPGGICCSYYMHPGSRQRLPCAPEDDEAYRFELGGGHWIFGGDPVVLRFIRALTPLECYDRRSSVFFPAQSLYVPYPLQDHLGYLPIEVRANALSEMFATPRSKSETLEEWLRQSFGETLTDLFFGPFHELYTVGLWKTIAPQDAYKSPVGLERVVRGMVEKNPPAGYNASFVYPTEGLDVLARRMAGRCDVHYGKRAVQIDLRRKRVLFADGSTVKYELLISTLPLNKMVEMARLSVDDRPDPCTSVLVLNIGAKRGPACPSDYWLYVPRSEAGFHRIGFYSNVNSSFLPESSRPSGDRVSIYVERAFVDGVIPKDGETGEYVEAAIRELRDWGYIGDVEVADPTWIDVAYTWAWPGSKWRAVALKKLEENDILMVGRYGRWSFQGIADSIRDGVRGRNRVSACIRPQWIRTTRPTPARSSWQVT